MMALQRTWAKVVAFLLLVPSLCLLGFGTILLRDSLSVSQEQTISYAKFSADPPEKGWYRVTGCRIDITRSVYESQNNVPVRSYVPVFDARQPQQQRTHVFAQMDDRKTLALLLDSYQQERFHTPEELRNWTQAHLKELIVQRELSGLLSRGIYRPTQPLNEKFAAVADDDINDCIILAEGWKPNPRLAMFELGIGIAGTLFILATMLANRSRRFV